jgi:anti-anti-sigma factor
MSGNVGTLQVKTTTTDGAPVVNVHGEVDMQTSPRLRLLLLELAAKLGGPLLIDLSGVTYMDSSGVGTMVYVKREVERAGRRLVLMGLQPRVRSVLEITHLDKFFTIVRNISEVAAS